MTTLRRLVLRDVVIVDELEVELHGGFTVLTGETGAGKSILIDALQLALGNRADASVVREGGERADVTAEFGLPIGGAAAGLRAWLDEAGFDSGDDDSGSLLLRRVVDLQGRSRAWVNGRPATLTQLRELGEQLVDIHGQHAWQSLTRPDAVRALLDEQAGADSAALSQAWRVRKQALARLDEARSRQADLARERERLQWQIAELSKLNPTAGEWDTLNEEHARLSHGQAILDAAQAALSAVSEAEDSAEHRVGEAIHALQEVAHLMPSLADGLAVLQDTRAMLQDAGRSLNAALNHTELDPQRLAELDDRLSGWMSQARRHRRQPAELPALLAGWQQELAALDAATDLDSLAAEADAAHAAWRKAAEAVSARRRAAAPVLSRSVTAVMQDLGMAGGRFEVALLPQDEPQAWGLEAVELRVAGHAGSTPRPLAKVASGGELSRLALAIAVTTVGQAADDGAPADAGGDAGSAATAGTLIFDEIDAGVGGQVGDTVGRLMQRLGQHLQVLAVTHLAQVAACADQHLVISKALRGGQTLSAARPVEAGERTAEIARMLGGEQGETGLAHAQAMLEAAQRDAGRSVASTNGTPATRPARRRKEPA